VTYRVFLPAAAPVSGKRNLSVTRAVPSPVNVGEGKEEKYETGKLHGSIVIVESFLIKSR